MRFAGGPKPEVTTTPEGWKVLSIGKDAEKAQPEIFKQIVELVAETFVLNQELALINVRNVLKSGGQFFYVLDRERVIGFSSFLPDPESGPTGARELRRGVGFTISTVRPEYRKKGVYDSLNRQRVDEVIKLRAAFFHMSTQNPVVEASMKKLLNEYVKEKRIKGYRFERKLTQSAYKQPYVREEPGKSGDAEIDKAYGALDIQKGETFQLEFNLEYPDKR